MRLLPCLFLLASLLPAQTLPGKWIAGDFHQHTLFTDGSHPLRTVIARGIQNGLGFQTNSEHGGASDRDGDGKPWSDPTAILGDARQGRQGNRAMWRWQSLRDHAFPEIQRLRKEHPQHLLLSGLEWNVPTHEHASTAIVATDARAIAEFEYRFDGGDADRTGGEAQGWTGKAAANSHEKAVAAARWMQENHRGRAYIVIAHADRQSSYRVEHYRDLNNAAPDVAFGFEGIPGHQKSNPRGGYGAQAFGGGTYGGAGIAVAQVGGVWDALLGEGRRWWNFVSSDFHGEKSDFWPGEYAKTWVYVRDSNTNGRYDEEDVVAGLASGRSFAAHGGLIDGLEFTAGRRATAAHMGETVKVKRGANLDVVIRFHTPARNQHGDTPQVHQVELIRGDVTGRIAPTDAAYTTGTNTSARREALFTAREWKPAAEGWRVIRYRLKNVTKSGYIRLRGTNLAPSTPHETDAQGNPLLDLEVTRNLKLTTEEAAWRDLWFYSNPIFFEVAQ